MTVRVRDARSDDLGFLQAMWHTAAFWQPDVFVMSEAEALAVPEIARYIDGWGRDGDVAVIAEEDGHPIGAAWYRSFTSDEPGYGFVDESTPELAIAVVADARRRSVGRCLLDALIARAQREGVRVLSLSVNAENPSRRLYLTSGFVDVSSDDGSYVMLLRLPSGA